ncbi:MAG TPA: glutamate-5-semialdehyde dehydrogenase [Myxococcales bacterium]|nr:glutamate-5-semialdehyde dehydrogenase [Myxococcales bacterium]
MSTVASLCRAARDAQPELANASTELRNAVLRTAAALLSQQEATILEANARDVENAHAQSLNSAMVDRLRLSPERLASISQSLESIAIFDDPVGQISELIERPNGLKVGRMRIPLGVVAIIFESRPNVVIDAGALCLKSGNAAILKGGKEAEHSNAALAHVLSQALVQNGLPKAAMTLLTDRSQVDDLLEQAETVDLVIPRGGEGLIRYVTANSRIPVIQHYKGVCHVYVDDKADLAMAADIAFNSKVQRPGVCNAMETLLVHQDVAAEFLPQMGKRLSDAGVEIRGCKKTRQWLPGSVEATDVDWDTEYLELILSVKIVDDMAHAIAHIRQHGSHHTEAIVTQDQARAREFVTRNDSSAVIVNASTRFNDGGQLGLGAEIGISTTKLHAFGPMGLNELTTRKFVVFGEGQIR